jgi:hypothetical protein
MPEEGAGQLGAGKGLAAAARSKILGQVRPTP